MSAPSLEQRIKTLEEQVSYLFAELKRLNAGRDWRSTAGMFTGDEVMREIVEEGRKIREKDRERARRRYTKASKPKTKS